MLVWPLLVYTHILYIFYFPDACLTFQSVLTSLICCNILGFTHPLLCLFFSEFISWFIFCNISFIHFTSPNACQTFFSIQTQIVKNLYTLVFWSALVQWIKFCVPFYTHFISLMLVWPFKVFSHHLFVAIFWSSYTRLYACFYSLLIPWFIFCYIAFVNFSLPMLVWLFVVYTHTIYQYKNLYLHIHACFWVCAC